MARAPVFSAMGAVAVLLTVVSGGYGYHRDELYFRMLEPAWGYVDQPPLTPLLVRAFSALVADDVWAIRIPATVAATASVLMVVLITRELGGGRGAQALCAWAYAFASTPLLLGHVMLTSSIDLLVWPAVTLLVMRALLRAQPGWWLGAGAVVGLSMYNKLLVAALLVAVGVGLMLVGPRRVLWSKWVWGAAALALAVGAPNLVYQATSDWPQLSMGAALSENNAAEVRVLMWPFLLLLLGPPLVPVWTAGLVALIRRAAWRPVRFLAAAFPVLLVLTFLAGSQLYYPFGLLAVLFAAGCVPVTEFLSRSSRWWRAGVAAAVAVNAVVSAVIALPLVPKSVVGDTPVPGINQLARDQVGWPTYVRQIATVYDAMPAAEARRTVIVTSNYGEAGAVARYGPELGLPKVYSGHNQLYFTARPPDQTAVAVVVGGQLQAVRGYFASCEVAGTLDNEVGVDNEEQGQPIAVCRDPSSHWDVIWPAFQHYD
ncbi:MAG TPA: glycosyltransferase family 39 protein [Nocardioidaceae bacterium]|nr:glycosyltransferase family 39 protein [Nocardioidaceae bacterium]